MAPINKVRSSAGFTLIELMIVVGVIAILAAIAYPSYTKHVIKTRRAAAAGCLMEGAQALERYYTVNMKYTGAPAFACSTDVSNYYNLTRTIPTDGSFTLTAAPQGTQASGDTQCGTIGIDQTGQKTASGTNSATPANCF